MVTRRCQATATKEKENSVKQDTPSKEEPSKPEERIKEEPKAKDSTEIVNEKKFPFENENTPKSTQIPSSKPAENNSKTDEIIDNTNEALNRTGDILNIIQDGTTIARDEHSKRYSNAKAKAASKPIVSSKLKNTIDQLEKTLKQLDNWMKNLDFVGKLFDFASFGLAVIKAIKGTMEDVVDLVVDTISAVLSNVVKLGGWIISMAVDAFKETDMYKNIRKSVIGFLTSIGFSKLLGKTQ